MMYRSIPAISASLLLAAPLMAQESQQEAVAENFREADANGDGKLNKDEFRTLINLNADDDIGNASRVKRFRRYNTAFERIDANSDGFVTPVEIRAAAEANR